MCYGVEGLAFNAVPGIPLSEDCLYIDVYTPSDATNHPQGMPVMLWIQGGAFVQLFNPNYNGTGIVESSGGNVIVVTFNYRVGPYGFLASDELQEEGNLNVGLHDQRAAMRWVEQHIAEFGGNPNNVTLFGTSVGGGSVLLQSLAYGGNPPPEDDIKWRRGIAEAVYMPSVNAVKDAEHSFNELLSATDCGDLACLRHLGSETLQEANIGRPFSGQSSLPLFPYAPVIDGSLLTDTPQKMLAAGHYSKERAVMIGSSDTEGTLFVPQANTTDEVNAFIKTQFPDITNKDLVEANKIYENVPRTMPGVTAPTSPYYYRLAKIYGDIAFSCPALEFALGFSSAGVDTRLFRNNIRDPAEVAASYIVPHTWELQAVWGPEYATQYVAVPGADSYSVGGVNRRIVSVVQSYWTSFSRTGSPNSLKQPCSPPWDAFGAGKRLRLQTNATMMEDVPQLELERCAFWRRLGARTHI